MVQSPGVVINASFKGEVQATEPLSSLLFSSLLGYIGLRVVLRDRLGQYLVGLKREQHIDSLRGLGLVCLTGGLVR
jgi:hypothetical protein